MAEELGHEIRVFTNAAISGTSNESSSYEESDDFYDLGPDDYYKLMSDRLGAKSQFLKPRKIREREAATVEAARRARVPKAVIRVRFPDNYILEAKFQSSDKVQCLMDLLMKVVARPDLPFHLYTTPPKKQIKDVDMLKDFYSSGFAPGANIYFSYDLPKGSEQNNGEHVGPYLCQEILSLEGLGFANDKADPIYSRQETSTAEASPAVHDTKPAAKKPTKPKWLKL